MRWRDSFPLTEEQYGLVKKAEHFWKGLSNNSSQISPVPPIGYGERFVNFITAITMTKEEAERQAAARSRSASQSRSLRQSARASGTGRHIGSSETNRTSAESHDRVKSPAERTLEKAQKQALKSERQGKSEEQAPERTLFAIQSPGSSASNTDKMGSGAGGGGAGVTVPSMTLPVVEEKDNEVASTGGRSGRSGRSNVSNSNQEKPLPELPDGVQIPHDSAMRQPNGSDFRHTMTASPTDFHLDHLSEKDEDHRLSDGNALLPGIPHLSPLTAEIPNDVLDPQKIDPVANDGVQHSPLTRKRSPLERWGTT